MALSIDRDCEPLAYLKVLRSILVKLYLSHRELHPVFEPGVSAIVESQTHISPV